MRILWLKSDLLLPLDKGGKLRTWYLLRHLAQRHDITYVAFASPNESTANIEGMREVARDVHVIPRSETRKGSVGFYARAAMRIADPLPYAVGTYRSRAYRQRVQSLLREGGFDLVVSDFILPAVNLPARLPCPSVVFTHNVESEIWRRHAETASGVTRPLYTAQYRRMLRFERRALDRFDGVLAVSHTDRDTLSRIYSDAIHGPVHVVQTGVDTGFFAPARAPEGSRTLVFTGSMDWLPNEDSMLYFCRDVLPRIRAQEPQVSISIVGRAPTPAVARLAQEPGVSVTGRVDDVRPYIAGSAVYVVPLRIGGGTRLKIFEAMAMGKAVVSTTVGAEGLPVQDGEHLLLADDSDSFASAVVRLLRDEARRRSLEEAARKLVVEHYDWAAVAGDLDRALTRVAKDSADPAAARASTPAAQAMVNEVHATTRAR